MIEKKMIEPLKRLFKNQKEENAKEGCVKMDEQNISSRIYACLDPFSTNLDGETGDTLSGGGWGPARLDGGEGPRMKSRVTWMKLRAVLFGVVFAVSLVAHLAFGVEVAPSVVDSSIFAGFVFLDIALDAYMRICDCVFCALKNALVKAFAKVSAWRSHNRRNVFALCLSSLVAFEASSPLFGGKPVWPVGLPLITLVSYVAAYDVHMFGALKAAAKALPSAFGMLRRKECMYVAASWDGLEAWIQSHRDGNVKRLVEVRAPKAEVAVDEPAPVIRQARIRLDVDEIKRTPPIVIANLMLLDEEFAREIELLGSLAEDGCDGELSNTLDWAYYYVDLIRSGLFREIVYGEDLD